MFAINSPKRETVITSSGVGIAKPSDKTILDYAQINKKGNKNTGLQMMAKKIIMSLSKNNTPSNVAQNISIQSREIEKCITPKETLQNNNLQENILYPNKEINHSIIRSDFSVLPNSQDKNFIDLNTVNLFFPNINDSSNKTQLSKGSEFAFFQNEAVGINDIQVTLDETQTDENVLTQREFDDEFPLVNINGGIVIPFCDNALPVKPLLSLSQAAAMPENTPLNFGVIDEQYTDNTPFIELPHVENNAYRTVNTVLNSDQKAMHHNDNSELHHLENSPRDTVNIDIGNDKENVLLDGDPPHFLGKKTFNEQLPLNQALADFRPELTKNEKKAPVLQEMADIEDVNIVQNRPPQINAVGEVYRQAQVLPFRDATTHSQSISQIVEHNVISHLAITNEHEPRTLTYTFHQWKNAPSVTFELAKKTELVVMTQSREVQETLKENKHLLNSEHDVYFRQKQHQERGQHHQQREHNQQEED
ncbi:hypothetical protein [Providencia rettgeri]|uniref:SpaN/EivJ family type III secretion system needle length determinant n=1 Tax=Providencia rettgeri TaxID=587 RepID=UPI00235E8AB9|nr:hypothetical protein [Providencia rettgeri]